MTFLTSIVFAAATVLACEATLSRFWVKRWTSRGISADWNATAWRYLRNGGALLMGVGFGLRFASGTAAVAFAAAAWTYLISTQSDLATRKIPREPCWAALVASSLAALTTGRPGLASMISAMILVSLALLLVVVLSRGRMGSGDVRLALAFTALAAWSGTGALLWGLILASPLQFALRLVFGRFWKTQNLGNGMPFGPALGAAIFLSIAIFGIPGTPALDWGFLL